MGADVAFSRVDKGNEKRELLAVGSSAVHGLMLGKKKGKVKRDDGPRACKLPP